MCILLIDHRAGIAIRNGMGGPTLPLPIGLC